MEVQKSIMAVQQQDILKSPVTGQALFVGISGFI